VAVSLQTIKNPNLNAPCSAVSLR